MPEYASTQINLPEFLAIQVMRAALKIEPRLKLEVLRASVSPYMLAYQGGARA